MDWHSHMVEFIDTAKILKMTKKDLRDYIIKLETCIEVLEMKIDEREDFIQKNKHLTD